MNKPFNFSVLILPTLVLVLLLCSVTLYGNRGTTYAWKTQPAAYFVNPGVLADNVSPEMYQTILSRLQYYYASQGSGNGHRLTVKPGSFVRDTDQSLSFIVFVGSSTTPHTVVVQMTDYGDATYSTTVYVDDSQSISYAPLNTLYGKDFEDFSTLTGSGLSATQVYEIESLLYNFQRADSYTVYTSTINSDTTTQNTLVSFKVILDDNTYRATCIFQGLTDVNLSLTTLSGKPVYQGKMDLPN